MRSVRRVCVLPRDHRPVPLEVEGLSSRAAVHIDDHPRDGDAAGFVVEHPADDPPIYLSTDLVVGGFSVRRG